MIINAINRYFIHAARASFSHVERVVRKLDHDDLVYILDTSCIARMVLRCADKPLVFSCGYNYQSQHLDLLDFRKVYVNLSKTADHRQTFETNDQISSYLIKLCNRIVLFGNEKELKKPMAVLGKINDGMGDWGKKVLCVNI